MGKERIKSTNLGVYLDKNLIEKIEVYFKTSIILSKLSKLCNNQAELHADDFYLIALSFGADIESMAEFVFKDYKVKEVTALELSGKKAKQELSKYGSFLLEFLTTQKTVAAKIGVDESRISKLIKVNSEKKLLAVEVYLTAKAFNQNVKESFEKICGHLSLNSSEEEIRLREIDRKKKADAKAVRNKAN